MLDLDARVHFDEVELAGVGIHAGTRPCRRCGSRTARPSRSAGSHRSRRGCVGRDTARARARPPSGCAAAPSSRARTGARGCRACRRGSALRCAARVATSFSRYTSSLPNAAFASRARACDGSASSASLFTTRMPRPPPPQLALSITRIADLGGQRRAAVGIVGGSGAGRRHHRHAGRDRELARARPCCRACA